MKLKEKFSSRKWWAALIALIVSILVLFDVDSITVERITALITAVSSMVVYTLTEGLIDAKAVSTDQKSMIQTLVDYEEDEEDDENA